MQTVGGSTAMWSSNVHWCALWCSLLLAGAADAATLRGYSFLQQPTVTLDQPAALESMQRMVQSGANSIVLIPFLHQGRIDSGEIGFSDAVTERQLLSAIEKARKLNLTIVLKPQILVDGGWAGDIHFGSDEDEARWFDRYTALLSYYARIAQREQVAALVIGTELSQIERSQRWRSLIQAIRNIYSGQLTYAAHGVEGIKRFSAWSDLDAVSVNLYPALGDSANPTALRRVIAEAVGDLYQATRTILRPVWVLEVGLPSAQGALLAPWDWRRLETGKHRVDLATQSTVIGIWLELLELRWIDAIYIWCWYSDPFAGGAGNIDYTLQNKPAEQQVRCRWMRECNGR